MQAPRDLTLWNSAEFWKAQLADLSEQKANRQGQLNQLRREESSLVEQLDIEKLRLPDRPIATMEDLDRLADRVGQLQQMLEIRRGKFHKTVGMLKTLYQSGIYSPNEDEENLMGETPDNFLYSDCNMSLIDELSGKVSSVS